ncbi:hypothetical protein GCM10010129_25650 [Streptomyces fumigatiscleroticus]|nr:hypothetical protein GCM10010129_25650 [Streptomyces fumigatiscleroticus]
MNRVGLGLAVGAGYVLGRTKKMKLAFAIGTMVAGKRMNLSPRGIADLVSQQLQNNPQFKEIGDQLREDLRGVGKAASGAMVERRLDAFADRLHGRTAQVRDQLAGVTPKASGSGSGSEEPEDEGRYEDEYDDEYDDRRGDRYDEEPRDEEPEDEEEPRDEEQPRERPRARGTAKKAAKRVPAQKAAEKAPARQAAKKTTAGKKTPAKKAAARTGTAKKTAAKKTAARGAVRGRRSQQGGE